MYSGPKRLGRSNLVAIREDRCAIALARAIGFLAGSAAAGVGPGALARRRARELAAAAGVAAVAGTAVAYPAAVTSLLTGFAGAGLLSRVALCRASGTAA